MQPDGGVKPVLSENKTIELLEWTDQFSVGNPKIDQDHKVIMSLINRRITIGNNSDQNENINDILDELLEYTTYHFDREELLMKVSEYPRLKKTQAGTSVPN